MDDILDDIVQVATRCERAARAFDTSPLNENLERLYNAIESVAKSWSGSWLGYHASLYLDGFRPPISGEWFDADWGLQFAGHSPGEWLEYDYQDIENEILARAGWKDTSILKQVAKEAHDAFDRSKAELLPTLDAILTTQNDLTLREIRGELAKQESHISQSVIAEIFTPKSFTSRDPRALAQAMQGMPSPPHLRFRFWLMEQQTYGQKAGELAKIARHAERYLRQSLKMKGRTMAKTEGKIFIGHGRSGVYKDLQLFIQNRLKLEWEEFNRESAAGLSTKERLETMLDNSCFAFLVMTAEDEHADSTKHARENVVHEVGLFQGRLGFRRAIILLEEGCTEFSNVHGVGQIRFPAGDIKAKFEEIREVLEREGII